MNLERLSAGTIKRDHLPAYGEGLIRDAKREGITDKAEIQAYCERRLAEARERSTAAVRKSSIHRAQRHFARAGKR